MPNGKKKEKKNYQVKTKSGGRAMVGKKAVDSAKVGGGAFKPMSFKGKLTKAGYKAADGSFTRSTGPVSRKKAVKKYEYDKKVFKKDSTAKAARTKRFATAKRKF